MNLTQDTRAALKLQVVAELSRRSFYEFVLAFWEVVVPDGFIANWHIKHICDELQEVGERLIKREPKEYDLIINVPPGESKSTVCTILFPCWLWVRDASLRIITGSYASALSANHAVKSRDVLRSPLFGAAFPNVELRKDFDQKTFYANTAKGERVAVSTGSAVTGMHGHIIIIDDPLNPKQAASSAELEAANRWFFETLPSRKVNKELTPTILIMQRLAENDPTGVWLEKAKDGAVKHICLPAELCDTLHPKELAGEYVGGIMNAARNTAATLEEMRTIIGSRAYASQFLQSPSPLEGGIIKKHWFGEFDGVRQGIINFYVDAAFTSKAENDPTALMAWFVKDNNLHIIDVAAVRMEFPELVRFVQDFANRNGYSQQSRIYVEPKAAGLSIVQQLRRATHLNIVEDTPPKDPKEVRLAAVSPIIEAGRVLLPTGAAWVPDFVDEVATFPNAKHDDRVDCLSASVRIALTQKRGIKSFKSIGI